MISTEENRMQPFAYDKKRSMLLNDFPGIRLKLVLSIDFLHIEDPFQRRHEVQSQQRRTPDTTRNGDG